MERPDDVEEVLLKVACRRLVVGSKIMIVKHARLARAGGTDVPAGVAADAARELPAPEREPLFGAHCFQPLDLIKPMTLGTVFPLLAQQLVEDHELFTLAGLALEKQRVRFFHRLFAVNRGNF